MIVAFALRDNINHSYDNDTALVGTNMVFAVIHNFGGMAGTQVAH
ncbi:phage virion morphogenesis protein, partial [Kingella kingae]